MKKLLFLGLVFSLVAPVHAIYTLDSGLGLRVVCISDYVFVRDSDTGIAQIMKKSPTTSNKSHTTPMSCSEYKKVSKD